MSGHPHTKVDISPARAELIDALVEPDQAKTVSHRMSFEQATAFTEQLLLTLNIASTSNIKSCRDFIKNHILVSRRRSAALIKYLLALSRSFAPQDDRGKREDVEVLTAAEDSVGLGKILNGRIQRLPLPEYKRLHILYLLNDVLLAAYIDWHINDAPTQPNIFKRQLLPHLITLIERAAFAKTGTHDEIAKLINVWATTEETIGVAIFDSSDIECLRLAQRVGRDASSWELLQKLIAEQEESERLKHPFQFVPDWLVPDNHGVPNDPLAPPHELPAANGLYLRRMHGAPINSRANPVGGKPLVDAGHEADTELKAIVETLYRDAIRCFDVHTDPQAVRNVDALGNKQYDQQSTRNYWGWSYDGLANRPDLEKKFADEARPYDGPLQAVPGGRRPLDMPMDGLPGRGGPNWGRGGGGYGRGGRGGGVMSDADRARALAEGRFGRGGLPFGQHHRGFGAERGTYGRGGRGGRGSWLG